jgi:hypothetical protein
MKLRALFDAGNLYPGLCASPRYTAWHGAPSRLEDFSTHVGLRFALASDDKWTLVQQQKERNDSAIAGDARARTLFLLEVGRTHRALYAIDDSP